MGLRFKMSEPKDQSYATRAEHCEEMALRMRDPQARHRFVELARKWRALARDAEDKDKKHDLDL